jgi:AcrR family transcriptional regulator
LSTSSRPQHEEAPISPRPYAAGKRQAAGSETRERIVAAARELLSAPDGVSSLTVDAVAQRADVARMTVYYQFKSKRGVLEALFDDLAARGGMRELRNVFQAADPFDALDAFVKQFVRFYGSDPVIIRRLNALSAIDPEMDEALSERGGWRREGLTTLAKRILGERATSKTLADVVDVLHVLTGFDMYDTLAKGGRKPAQIVAVIQRTARAVVSATG